MPGAVFIGLILLMGVLILELIFPEKLKEGFDSLVPVVPKNSYFATKFPRRGDITYNKDATGYTRDRRYFGDYADVQRLGAKQDFCRMVVPKGKDEDAMFFACALGGSDTVSSVIFKTKTVGDRENPFKVSRDDYMVVSKSDGYSSYCRILKGNEGVYLPYCLRANDTGFSTKEIVDSDPPDSIVRLLSYYDGCVMWLRFRDDMLDYVKNVTVYTQNAYIEGPKEPTLADIAAEKAAIRTLQTGPIAIEAAEKKAADAEAAAASSPTRETKLEAATAVASLKRLRSQIDDIINEVPNQKTTEGVRFDGVRQFIRIGDIADLTLGTIVPLRSVRSFSMWVYFDQFTNNAHFFDFGDGPGKNNVFLGLLGKGDPQIGGGGELRPLLCGGDNTLPNGPSGAQAVPEMSPQELMRTTAGNVDECDSVMPEVVARRLPPSSVELPQPTGPSNVGTLIYEVWDSRQRKMSIKINGVLPVKKWTHIAVTALTGDATRPDIGVFVNGKQVFTQTSGFLPQATMTSKNYFAKSNWTNDTSTYELRDDLFAGRLFDFRMYKKQLSQDMIIDIVSWGKDLLGI
jgi:hypothetical protein